MELSKDTMNLVEDLDVNVEEETKESSTSFCLSENAAQCPEEALPQGFVAHGNPHSLLPTPRPLAATASWPSLAYYGCSPQR